MVMVKHFIETVGMYNFRFNGSLGASYEEKEVESRESNGIPDEVFGFRYFDREVIIVEGKEIYGEKINISPWTYIGEIFTKEDIAKKFPEQKILLENMEANNLDRMLHARFDNWIPLGDEDRVITLILHL